MAVPSKTFTVVPDANLLQGKPGLATDWTAINGNTIHNEEWIGKDYVAAQNHDHDGVNSAAMGAGSIGQSQIASGAVHQAELSTSSVETTLNVTGHFYPAGNTSYGFFPRFHRSSGTDGRTLTIEIIQTMAGGTLGNTAKLLLYAGLGAGSSVFRCSIRQITSSPPHRFNGCPIWGKFLTIKRNKKTGELLMASTSTDPIWAGSWSKLPKNHPGRIAQMPHPFPDPLKENEEIILVDLRHLNIEEECLKEKSILENMIAQKQELIELGCTEAELTEEEEKQQVKVVKERQEIDEAKENIEEAKTWRDKAIKDKKNTDSKELTELKCARLIAREKPKLRLYKKHDLISHEKLIADYKEADKTVKQFPQFRVVTI